MLEPVDAEPPRSILKMLGTRSDELVSLAVSECVAINPGHHVKCASDAEAAGVLVANNQD